MLAITYFHLFSEISLSIYWEGDLKANVKREYFFLVEIIQSKWHNLSLCPVPCGQKGTDSYETSRFDLIFSCYNR